MRKKNARCECGHTTTYHQQGACQGHTYTVGNGYYDPCACETFKETK